ncbi:MAG: hypothetical protein AAGD25_06650 [Cyanobacteria bacterium P01_F01_bin.150]
MVSSRANLVRLLQSTNGNVHLLAIAAGFLFFFPTVTQVLDRPDLSVWERTEMLSIAVGELLFTLGAASASPETFLDEDDD